MRLYDTARRAVVSFEAGPVVTMYVCGVTPYDATHMGHAATYVTYDVLIRRLRDLGHEVRMVRNITDVDDDILRTARDRDVHYLDLATAEIRRFDDDLAALNVLPPWSSPRATSAIADIRGFIGAVIDRGDAYAVDGWVFFDVSTASSFGALCGLDRSAMLAVGPAGGENPDNPLKRNPLDFVLWKPALVGEPSWESRWGPGRPGWHVECSTLALRELGETIDLHGGGTDLLYPHHECERAQSESVTGRPFVRHWMHQAMVGYDGQKMSKSVGNLVFVHDLRAHWSGPEIRTALLAHHYRTDWSWSTDDLIHARARLEVWRSVGAEAAPVPAGFIAEAIDADLDTPEALRMLDAAAADGRDVAAPAELLGIALKDGANAPMP
ncbi:MAG: cysteine--tRNA ligase [Acidimicrobiales bacterium]|nr:cysteine--tRNA ligase [Acidimicrobiales bacterium]